MIARDAEQCDDQVGLKLVSYRKKRFGGIRSIINRSSSNDLWTRYREHGDPDAREEIILRYMPLVKFVAGRMAIGPLTILDNQDILAHGTVGLIEAVGRFDPDRGIKFETYAIQRIRGSIIDAFRRLDWFPRNLNHEAREVESAYSELQQELQRDPTDTEIVEHSSITPRQLRNVQCRQLRFVESLDDAGDNSYSDEHEPISLLERIEDVLSPSPTLLAEEWEVHDALVQAIIKLPKRDRLVICFRYIEGLSLEEIGLVLGISSSRVCQLSSRATLRLRNTLLATRLFVRNQLDERRVVRMRR